MWFGKREENGGDEGVERMGKQTRQIHILCEKNRNDKDTTNKKTIDYRFISYTFEGP